MINRHGNEHMIQTIYKSKGYLEHHKYSCQLIDLDRDKK